MALPIDQLKDPIPPASIEATLLALLKAFSMPVDSWAKRSAVRVLVRAVAHVISSMTELVAIITRAGFLDLAEGIYLTLLAWYVYSVTRLEAVYASGNITVDNAKGGIFEFEPGEFVVLNSTTNKTYANVSTFSIGALETGVTVAVRALESGEASTAQAGEIDALVTTYIGLSVTNDTALIGGDEETDPDLRQRCRDSLGRLSPFGPEAAYIYFAKSARRLADNAPIGVNRVWVSSSGVPVTVYVAGTSGEVAGDANDTATDLGKVAYDVAEYACPNPVTCITDTATALPVPIAGTIYVDRAGALSEAEARTLADTAIKALFKKVPIGGYLLTGAPSGKLFRNTLVGVIEAASPYIIKFDPTLPAGDTTIGEGVVATPSYVLADLLVEQVTVVS